MKRNVYIVLTSVILSSTITPVLAENELVTDEKTNETFEFNDYSFTENIDIENYSIIHEESKDEESYYIINNDTNLVEEKLTVSSPQISTLASNGTRTSFFTKDKNINNSSMTVATVRFTACVTLYSSGSFRSFNALQYTNLAMADSITTLSLTNIDKSAWSNSGSWPCARIDFAYTANIYGSGSIDISIGNELVSAGFTHTSYYYKYISSSGSFNLYN